MWKIQKFEWFLVVMAVTFFLTGAAFYSHVPGLVVSHWNAMGTPNGYMSRFWGVFLLPIIFLFIALMLFLIPRVDPHRENIAKFRKYFNYFVVGITIFFYYVYVLVLSWNVGYRFDFTVALIPALAVVFYLIGMLLPKTEQNWTIGIRTPWTISSKTVWGKTHKAGGPVFKAAAIISLVGLVFPTLAPWFIAVPVIVAALGLAIYSYVLYEKEGAGK